ncbi:hypothetical protein CC80DRAFT_547912 [Byssothecium circinans]|uniref:Uncharacterized protein n=1 Tax=Byssothecium circinans TaxID=147558 RepID=A0A6A5TXY1_9PLEO|nr:hypothetical protein CC80DRAFT_547912 [Byssothecium circinans]
MAMHHRARSDAGELISSPRSRTSSRAQSFSSDRASVAGSVTFQMPTPSNVRPAPAYIAASVASQLVTDNQNAHIQETADQDYDDESSDAHVNALFSEQALSLLNAFLDHLLFAFLVSARSPSLTAIRPAITEVLKPRLARDAMSTADEELEGLLAGEDEEEFPTQDGKEEQKWDVEKVWKRTRLRIMVYTRLGELEDEDEERYVQQERGLSMDDSDDEEAGLVSWASAIFLTSVIEHIAEQTLLASGQAAFSRTSAKLKKLARQSLDGEEQPLERLVVEEFDVEKLALNSALGRLWRTWRKRVRSPAHPLSPRGVRSISSIASLHRRKGSHDTTHELDDRVREVPEHEPTVTEIAANIPLPIGDNDVNEIEVPGLARTFEGDESSDQRPVMRPRRPSSVILLASPETFRSRGIKERPLSMPPPQALPFVVPMASEAEQRERELEKVKEIETSEDEADELPFETPMEKMSNDESYIHNERQEDLDHEVDGDHEADADMVAFAASTGMGFGMGPMDPIKTADLSKNHDDSSTPTQATYGQRSQVLQSKRVSIEKTGPPGIVRTYSTRSSSLKSHPTPESTPQATPKLENRSLLDDGYAENDTTDAEAIGVAHTSNIPIPTPSPSNELPSQGKGKHPSHGGYVEVLPRQTAPTSIQVRNTPTPEAGPSPADNSMPRKEVQRKEVSRKDVPASPTNQPRPRDLTPPQARKAPLSAVREAEGSWSARTHSPARGDKSVHRSSDPRSSPKQNSSLRSCDSPVPVTERAVKPKALDTNTRPRSGTADGMASDRSPLQRMSSSSSTNRSVGTSILQSGRDSSASLDGRTRGLSVRMSEEDRQREFDSLVQGGETVKVTLTPQTVRDIDAQPAPQEPPKATSPPKAHKPSASVTVYPRVNANLNNGFGSQHLPNRSTSRSKGPIPSSGNKVPMKKPLAREPRIQNESMQDFADFIRSTGPSPGGERPVQPFVPLKGADTRPKSNSPSNNSSASLGGLGRKISMRKSASHSQSNSTINDGPSARPRVHMEPRSPAGQGTGNDDLIDFIRQGPPGPNNGQPRIPRSVAPFRTTVDSDQFDTMLDDHGTVESAYGSQVSNTSRQSVQTSTSRTDLLPKQKVVQPAYSNTPQKLTGNYSSGNEPVIQKTRRRIKDPYAIDSDDEDEDLLTALPNNTAKSPPARDESMMDFLNSMDPPSNSKPEAFVLSPETIAAAKARATRTATSPTTTTMTSSTKSSRNGRTASAQPAIISSNVMSDAPRAHKPRLQPRAPATDTRRSGTNDLADFLRSSGPPEPPVKRGGEGASSPPPGSTARREEGKRSAAKFWRKKTSSDMP